jgi:hypothetical protein
VSLTWPVLPLTKDVGWLDVLVDKAALMEFTQRRGNTHGQA